MYVLRLFGVLSLESDAGAVPSVATQRRRLTLLALLGLAGERGMARERIQAYLWPESSSDRARHALDQLLYATRQGLGPDVILSSASDLRLNRAAVRTDVQQFETAIAAHRWEEAVALYEGPVLDGLHPVDGADFEGWLESVRSRREGEFRRALESLARSATARGDHEGAARFWRNRAESEPLSAPVAVELMGALVRAGDRGGAVRHAQAHQSLVWETLELEPDSIVGALAADIRSADSPASAKGAPAMIAEAAQPVTEPATADDALTDVEPLVPNGGNVAISPRAPPWRGRLAMAGLLAALASVSVATALLVSAHTRRTSGANGPTRVRGDSTPAAAVDRVARAAHGASTPEAARLYLTAYGLWERRTKEGLDSAVVLYRQATEHDPTFAAAYAGLAQSYAMLGYFGFGPADAMFPKARSAAFRAIELDAGSGDAYAALGQVLSWEHRWRDAEAAYTKALALSPDDPTVHQWYALMLAYMGRAREAVVHTRIASQLAPLSVQINNFHGVMLYYSGDLDGALRQFERTVEAEPDSSWVRQNPWVLTNYGSILAAAGRYDDAERLIRRGLEAVPANPRALLDLASVYRLSGDSARARATFARADSTNPQFLMYLALFHASMGELDLAFRSFDQVHAWPLAPLVGLSNDPAYARLRADPRYDRIRNEFGFDERNGRRTAGRNIGRGP